MRKLFNTIILFGTLFYSCTFAKEYNIQDYGAINDGKTLNTKFIQKAIDDASKNNGGTIIIENGRYLSGTIVLKSNIKIEIKENATLLGSSNPYHYKRIETPNMPTSPKTDDYTKLALLIAHGQKNITITGGGTIDGQGSKLALTIDSLHHIGEAIDPHYGSRASERVRPKIINIGMCKNVFVNNLNINNSSNWVQTYELSVHIRIKDINVNSVAYWNNDGLNITDSKDVIIEHCNINSADDGITLKSYYPGKYNENITIKNCTIRSSASAVKFGTASIGGFKNVHIENINVYDTFRSAIALEAVDGGFIEDITVKNITAKNTKNALFVRLGHRMGKKAGYAKNIIFENFKVEVPFGRPDINYDLRGPALGYFHNPLPASISGIPEANIENITLKNIEITYPGRASKTMAYKPIWRLEDIPEKIGSYPEFSMFGELPSWAFYIRHVKGIRFENIHLKLKNKDFRPAFVFDDVEQISISKLKIPNLKKQIILRNCNTDKNNLPKEMWKEVK
jgi:hypothetical protein